MAEPSPRTGRRVAAASALLALLLGALGLLGWGLRLPVLTSISPQYQPTAPSLACALLLLGLLLAGEARGGTRGRGAAAVLAGLISLYGLLEFIGFVVGTDLTREEALARYLARVWSRPFTTMSPAAGTLLFLLGASLLALQFAALVRSPQGERWKEAAGALGALAALGALIFALGYLYGAPLLYHTGLIPVAAPAALSFLLLGVGAVAAAGTGYWPLRVFVGASVRAQLLRVFVPLAVLAVLLSSLLREWMPATAHLNQALQWALLATVFALLAGVVGYRMATVLGGTIEAAQREAREAQRRRAELAETMNREIAHRVKNNLAMVTGILQMQIAQEQEARVVEALRETMSRLLAFTSINEQLQASGEEDLDLLAVVRRVVQTACSALKEKAVTASVEGEPAPYPASVVTSLSVIVNELITNAIKHGAPGADGKLHVEVRLHRSEGVLTLSVHNSGPPVPADFDPRAQSGLGLRLVWGLMEHYGGSFTLSPEAQGNLAALAMPEERLH